MDRTFEFVSAFGIGALTYDFTPVSFTPEGEVINPSVIASRNAPADMMELWCGAGLYQVDPVQKLALRSTRPFC